MRVGQFTVYGIITVMRTRYKVLFGLFLLGAITYLDRVCISLSSVRIRRDLHLTPDQWGWVLAVFSISYALFEIPTGLMADRLGSRRTLTRIVVWWSAFTAMTGGAFNYLSLLFVRFAFGAGEAGAIPTASSAIARWFPLKERARAIGILWLSTRVGGAVAPQMLVRMQQGIGWRFTFGALGIVGLVWAAVWYWLFRDRPSEIRGISKQEIEEIGETPLAEHKALPWGKVSRNSNFWLILIMYHAYCWGSYFFLSWMPTYLQSGRGFTENQMAIWATLPFILSGTANFGGGALSDFLVPRIGLRWARRSIGATGLILGGVFLALTASSTSNELAAVFLAIGYGCMDAMLPVSWAVCLDVGGKYSGAISAAMNTSGQVGSFLSTVFFGYAVRELQARQFSDTVSYSLPLYPLAAMLLVSGICFLKIHPDRPMFSTTD